MTLVDRFTHTASASVVVGVLGRVALVGFLLSALALPAMARTTSVVEDFTGIVPISDDELRSKRGGIIVNGVDFGAIVHILVSNELVAETHIALNGDGTLSRMTTIHNGALAAEFTDLSQLEGSGIQISGPKGSIGVIISDSNGISIALNSINAGKLFGLVANNAIGREISQTIDATLTINNFSQISAGLLGDIAAGRAMKAGAPDLMLP